MIIMMMIIYTHLNSNQNYLEVEYLKSMFAVGLWHVKTTFSFHKLIPKNGQMTTLSCLYILIGHCTSPLP